MFFFCIQLRFISVLNDIWLDEAWSIERIKHIKSIWGVFTEIHHDNNHYLNSAFLYILNKLGLIRLARLPSLLFSIITLALVSWNFRKNKTQLILSIILIGFNFPLIHFGTEARGYSSLFFFAILSFFLIDKVNQSKRSYWSFQISQCLGFLSHLSFSSVALSLGIKYFIRNFNEDKNIFKSLLNTIKLEIPSLVFIATLYLINIRHIKVGGGPQRPFLGFLNDMSDLFLSRNLIFAFLLSAISVIFLINSRKNFFRKDFWLHENKVFSLLIFILVPLFNFIFSTYYFSKSAPFPRHFIMNYLFLLIFMIPFLAKEFHSKTNSKPILVISFFVFFLFGGFYNFKDFLSYGRGQYKAAIEFINQNSFGNTVNVTCINFRDCSMISLNFGQFGDKTKRFFIIPYSGRYQRVQDHWAIRASVFHGEKFSSKLRMLNGSNMEFIKEYPSAQFSGATWVLYKNLNPEIPDANR